MELSRSVSTVYPARDGYRDAITFGVRPLDAAGKPVAVTGRAYIVRRGTIAKTYDLGVATLVSWNGQVGGAVVPGAYSFVIDVRSAAGTAAQSTSAFTVSGKRLTHRTLVVKHVKQAGKLPATVQRNLGHGRVTVRAALRHRAASAVRVDIRRTGTDRHLVVRAGARTSNRVTVPAASRQVKVVVPKATRSAVVRKLVLTYRFTSLG